MINNITCITINTDASFCPIHKVSGYSFYIVCDTFKIKKGGKFLKQQPQNPEEAEMMCIGNAIQTLLAQKELPAVKLIVLNSDCKFGMRKIKTADGDLGKQINGFWSELLRRTGARFNAMKYVRAHSGVEDARSKVNEWCDKEAKRWMRISRNEITDGNEKAR